MFDPRVQDCLGALYDGVQGDDPDVSDQDYRQGERQPGSLKKIADGGNKAASRPSCIGHACQVQKGYQHEQADALGEPEKDEERQGPNHLHPRENEQFFNVGPQHLPIIYD
jgi:hypothetical protein